jgi:hypothetical protein
MRRAGISLPREVEAEMITLRRCAKPAELNLDELVVGLRRRRVSECGINDCASAFDRSRLWHF